MGACVCVRERAAVVVHQVCENVAVGGFFFVVHTVAASCQAIAHPPGIISAGCGRRREFLLSLYRCFWIYMLILWAKNYIKNLAAILFCVFACMRVFFCIAQGNKCPLSLSKCQISYQHLPACCCDIYAHTHTDTYTHTAGVQHYSGTHKTGWSNTVYIFIKVKVKNLAFEWNASFVVERAQVCALLRSLASHCLRVYCMR